MRPLPALLLLAALGAPPAAALLPPPDYRAELDQKMAAELSALNGGDAWEQVVEKGEAYIEALGPSAPVAYELGFAENHLGHLSSALRWYGMAIEVDPNDPAARYDRGELLLASGKLDLAAADFQVASELRPDHWAAWFRLSQVAGARGDAAAFEAHLIEAMRQGLDTRMLVADPSWRAFSRDPALGPVLKRLITVYGDESILPALQAP